MGTVGRPTTRTTHRGTPEIHVRRTQVARFRLARQHLDARVPGRMLLAAVRDMGGAQAQVLSAAYTSLWARVGPLRAADVDAAMQRRTLVKAWCMRHTLHLVPADELAVFVRGSAGRAEREIRWMRGRGVPERTIEGIIDAALEAMDQPRTRREIAERVSRSRGVRQREYVGGGWGNRARIPAVAVGGMTVPVVWLFNLVGGRGVMCSGPARGAEPTFVRADAWIPRWRDIPRAVAEQRLLRSYLRTFGPAAPSDFAYWVGIPLRDALAIWAREEPNLAYVSVDGSPAAVVREDVPQITGPARVPPPVRLLPYFDAYLLGHRDRRHLVAPEKLKLVYRPQGWVTPVVLVDGRVAGTWSLSRNRDGLVVDAAPFGSFTRGVITAIHDEAQRLGRFLGVPSVEVRVR